MHATLAALAALLGIVPQPGVHSPCTDLVPPAQYWHMPRPHYRVVLLDTVDAVRAECGDVHLGCSDADSMTVWRLKTIEPGSRLACFLFHEEAHLLGWPGDHPGALWFPPAP